MSVIRNGADNIDFTNRITALSVVVGTKVDKVAGLVLTILLVIKL